jgi:hypothetical protein
MPRPRKSLCTAALLALLAVPSLSGCAAEGPPGAARAQAGVFGEIYEQLKQEDDEAETRQIAQWREAGREQHEIENATEVEWR